MKYTLFNILVTIAWILLPVKPAITQSGNGSDITGPNMDAIVNPLPQDNQEQPNQEQPNQEQPNQEQPNQGQPNQQQPNQGQPNQGQPNQGPPNQGPPNQGQPNQGQPNQGQPNQGQPNQGQPNQQQPNQGQPNQGQPNQGQPNQGQPNQGPPNQGPPNQGPPNQGPPNQGPPNQGPPNQGPPNQGPPNQGPPNQGPPNQGPPNQGQPNQEPPNQQESDRTGDTNTNSDTNIQVQSVNQSPPEAAPATTQSNQSSDRTEEKPVEESEASTSEDEKVQEIEAVEQEVDRPAYEAQVQQVDVDVAVQLIEEYQAVEFSDYLGLELYGDVPSFNEISVTLYDLWQVTGQKAAFVYVSASDNQLDLFTVVPSPSGVAQRDPQLLASTRSIPGAIVAQTTGPTQHLKLPEVKGKKLREKIQKFRQQITDPRHRKSQKYLTTAQELYQWLIAPMEAQLEAEGIDILVLSMDSGLRSIPLAALHDGEQFLIEKYGVALVPSFGLTDVSYSDVRQTPILAMGASEFTELNDLPAVPIEMENILINSWESQSYLNEEFTVEKFKSVNQENRFGIIHLATHGEFKAGNLSQSYIQFYNQKLNMIELKEIANQLGWSQTEKPAIELLVLSACRTAVGSPEAELGFAGLAVQAGVKSALASLWYVSDAGTLGLMSEFYRNLSENPIKSQALRETQIAMLNGELRIENGQLRLPNGETLPLTPELAAAGNVDFSDPYFWSGFMMIGNWN